MLTRMPLLCLLWTPLTWASTALGCVSGMHAHVHTYTCTYVHPHLHTPTHTRLIVHTYMYACIDYSFGLHCTFDLGRSYIVVNYQSHSLFRFTSITYSGTSLTRWWHCVALWLGHCPLCLSALPGITSNSDYQGSAHM